MQSISGNVSVSVQDRNRYYGHKILHFLTSVSLGFWHVASAQ